MPIRLGLHQRKPRCKSGHLVGIDSMPGCDGVADNLTNTLLRTVRRLVFATSFETPQTCEDFHGGQLRNLLLSDLGKQQIVERPVGLDARLFGEGLLSPPFGCHLTKCVRVDRPFGLISTERPPPSLSL